jgi:hypothetical protein
MNPTRVMLALSLFLTIGGYILQRNKYWRRIWEELGKPVVKNVKELKALVRSSGHSAFGYRHRRAKRAWVHEGISANVLQQRTENSMQIIEANSASETVKGEVISWFS